MDFSIFTLGNEIVVKENIDPDSPPKQNASFNRNL